MVNGEHLCNGPININWLFYQRDNRHLFRGDKAQNDRNECQCAHQPASRRRVPRSDNIPRHALDSVWPVNICTLQGIRCYCRHRSSVLQARRRSFGCFAVVRNCLTAEARPLNHTACCMSWTGNWKAINLVCHATWSVKPELRLIANWLGALRFGEW